MQVLVLVNDVSTVTNFRIQLLRRLVELGHHVTVGLPEGRGVELIHETGALVVPWDVTRKGVNVIRELRAVLELARIVRASSPDVLLTYTVKPNVYTALINVVLRRPHIATVTGLGSVISDKSTLAGRVLLTLQRWLVSRADRVFFQNEENLARFAVGSRRRARFQLVPGSGVDLHEFESRPYPAQSAPVRLAVVSRIRDDKGINELVKCIEHGQAEGLDVFYDIVGWPEDLALAAKVRRLAAAGLCRYRTEASREEVKQVLTAAHALVHPSYHEGMSNAVLEACATGRPVLASDIPGCREAVIDGKTGHLFAPRSSTALTKTVERFLATSHEERTAMARRARRLAEQKFDRSAVVATYVDTIGTVGTPVIENAH